MILKTSYVNQRSRPANRGRTTTRKSAQRSWRTVKTARQDANALIIRANSKGFADDAPGLDCDHQGDDAGKVRVQCAAGVSKVSAVVTVMMGLAFVGRVIAMLMIAVRSRVRNRLRIGAR